MPKVKVSKRELLRKFGFIASPAAIPDFIELEAEIVEEKCEHERGEIAYLSHPPMYKCKKCGGFYTDDIPWIPKAPEPLKEIEEIPYLYNYSNPNEVGKKINDLVDAVNLLNKQK